MMLCIIVYNSSLHPLRYLYTKTLKIYIDDRLTLFDYRSSESGKIALLYILRCDAVGAYLH